MLFGAKTDEKRLDELEGFLNSVFDERLRGFEVKARNITNSLVSEKSYFERACAEFAALEAEPEIENRYFEKANVIRDQKESYARALKHIIGSWEPAPESHANVYERYEAVLSAGDAFIQEMLRANASFNKVLHSYSNHLGNFKRSFSSVERETRSLRGELERHRERFSEYEGLRARIRELSGLQSEIERAEQGLRETQQRAAGEKKERGTVDEPATAKEAAQALNAELGRVREEAASLRGSINSLLAPLDKPARKFDHASGKKIALHAFVDNPLGTIRSESDYRTFVDLLGELERSVASGTIETKDNSVVGTAVSRLLGADLHRMIVHLREVERKVESLSHQARAAADAVRRVEDERLGAAEAAERIEARARELADMRKRKEEEKKEVAKRFLEHYRVRLSIIG
jgi:predicted  nucleic acid-binding Zn-ribbon protein